VDRDTVKKSGILTDKSRKRKNKEDRGLDFLDSRVFGEGIHDKSFWIPRGKFRLEGNFKAYRAKKPELQKKGGENHEVRVSVSSGFLGVGPDRTAF